MQWSSSKKNEQSAQLQWLQDRFRNQNIGSFVSSLGIAVNKGSPRELEP